MAMIKVNERMCKLADCIMSMNFLISKLESQIKPFRKSLSDPFVSTDLVYDMYRYSTRKANALKPESTPKDVDTYELLRNIHKKLDNDASYNQLSIDREKLEKLNQEFIHLYNELLISLTADKFIDELSQYIPRGKNIYIGEMYVSSISLDFIFCNVARVKGRLKHVTLDKDYIEKEIQCADTVITACDLLLSIIEDIEKGD